MPPVPHYHARRTPPSATRVTADPVQLIDAPPASPRGRLLHADIGIRIDREGLWYYHGSVIQRKELMCLFASTLTRDTEGGYWLVTPTEMGRIDVEDVPFLAVEAFVAGEGLNRNISFRTNVDEIVTADKSNPVYVVTHARTGEPTPYVCLPRKREARIARTVFYDLVAHGEERPGSDGREFGIWSRGTFFVLGDPGADA
jgi:uncharacterized protein